MEDGGDGFGCGTGAGGTRRNHGGFRCGRAFAQRYSEGVSADGSRHGLRLSLRSSWVSE